MYISYSRIYTYKLELQFHVKGMEQTPCFHKKYLVETFPIGTSFEMKDDLLAWISSGYADSRLHFFGSMQMYIRDVNSFLKLECVYS
jgi:hypothetical protein